MKQEEVLQAVRGNEDMIRKQIIHQLNQPKTAHNLDIMFDPDTKKISIKEDDGSWFHKENRQFLASIKPGIDEYYVDMLFKHSEKASEERYKIDDWKIEDFGKGGKYYPGEMEYNLDDVVDEQYDFIICAIEDGLDLEYEMPD